MKGTMTAMNARTRLEKLKTLAEILADEIDQRPGARDIAQLAKQYRETLRDIEDIEGEPTEHDAISEILQDRAADGKPGAVRKNRARLPGN